MRLGDTLLARDAWNCGAASVLQVSGPARPKKWLNWFVHAAKRPDGVVIRNLLFSHRLTRGGGELEVSRRRGQLRTRLIWSPFFGPRVFG